MFKIDKSKVALTGIKDFSPQEIPIYLNNSSEYHMQRHTSLNSQGRFKKKILLHLVNIL